MLYDSDSTSLGRDFLLWSKGKYFSWISSKLCWFWCRTVWEFVCECFLSYNFQLFFVCHSTNIYLLSTKLNKHSAASFGYVCDIFCIAWVCHRVGLRPIPLKSEFICNLTFKSRSKGQFSTAMINNLSSQIRNFQKGRNCIEKNSNMTINKTSAST